MDKKVPICDVQSLVEAWSDEHGQAARGVVEFLRKQDVTMTMQWYSLRREALLTIYKRRLKSNVPGVIELVESLRRSTDDVVLMSDVITMDNSGGAFALIANAALSEVLSVLVHHAAPSGD